MRLLSYILPILLLTSPLLIGVHAEPAYDLNVGGKSHSHILSFSISNIAHAQGDEGGGPGGDDEGGGPGGDDEGGGQPGMGLVNPLQNIDSFPDLLAAILGAVVQIGFMLLILMLVFVGFKFVAAQGKEEELRNARSALVWTVIGGLILLGAEAISLVIQSTAEAL